MLAFQPTYSAEAARELIGQETGFGEVHLLMGQRAFLNGDLAGAFRELTRARELLPDSVSIKFALANITFCVRAICRRVGAVRSHPRESRGDRPRAAGEARPREVAELSEAPRRGHRAADRSAAERSEQQSWRKILLARVEPTAARPGAARLRRCDGGIERDAQRRDLPARGHGVVQPRSSRRIAQVLRRGAEDESRRLRFGALSRVAGFGRAQLEAGIGPFFGGGVVLRSV